MPAISHLPTHEVMILRGIKKIAVVLFLLRLDRPIKAREVASILDLSYPTAIAYLRRLSHANFITRTRSGSILTQYGSQLVLPVNSQTQAEILKNVKIFTPLNNSINSSNSNNPPPIINHIKNFDDVEGGSSNNGEIWKKFLP
jgi:predicted transcriptional regulator